MVTAFMFLYIYLSMHLFGRFPGRYRSGESLPETQPGPPKGRKTATQTPYSGLLSLLQSPERLSPSPLCQSHPSFRSTPNSWSPSLTACHALRAACVPSLWEGKGGCPTLFLRKYIFTHLCRQARLRRPIACANIQTFLQTRKQT